MKSPLIRRLIIGAQCLRMSIRAHRAPIIKPPSERQFDAPRQKLADARFERLLEKGRCPFRRLALPISPIPQTIKDSVVFSESFVFLLYSQNCYAILLYSFVDPPSFEGIGAICVANRRKGLRPFNGRRTLRPQASDRRKWGALAPLRLSGPERI